MTKEQAYKELKELWGLDKNTTDEQIITYFSWCSCDPDYYTTLQRRLYCYSVALKSMERDGDLDDEIANEIMQEIGGDYCA